MKYEHKKIEKRWQAEWEKNKIYTTPDQVPGKDNFFLLVEFPYPSGNLHVGHWYAFAVPDILARAKRMQGKNVMYPIGFDAFGLPAENAAIKNKLNPRDWTEKNIAYMKNQIRSMGTSFDWSREVSTIDPAYYKWTQWLFLRLYKKGLVYQKETAVNWCPQDKTVLANEQVVDGKCERCGAEVIQRQMLQWNIKITDYADRLVDELDALDWPQQIKESQKNWIGRSEGAEIDFPLEFEDKDGPQPNYLLLHGYTGRADKNFIPNLKRELEARGYEVQAPQMPNTDNPREDEQVPYVLQNCKMDERTIIVGHSLGAVIAMKVVEKLNHSVAGLVLVAPAVEPEFRTGDERPFWSTFEWRYDYDRIRKSCGFRLLLSDTREKSKRGSYIEYLSQKVSALVAESSANREHFTGATEPFILSNLLPNIMVFTTRPDTLFGATYLVLSPEHPWVTMALEHKTVLKNNSEVQKYITQAKKKTDMERQVDKEKSGVRLEGVEAVNPATGEKIPLYVADYVLAHYGTGAIMAVPAHDERDYEFAKKFNLPVRQVVIPMYGAEDKRPDSVHRQTVSAIVRNKKGELLLLRWPEYKWLTGVIGGIENGETAEQAAEREVLEETGYKARVIFTAPIQIESHFYAEHKKEWRARIDTPVLLELVDEDAVPIEQDEAARHQIQWTNINAALSSEMFRNNKLAIELALERFTAYTSPHYGEEQVLVNSGDFNGMTVEEAKKAMTEKYGRSKKTYKLRDWIVSRQRYWGVPIPVMHCGKCGPQPVADGELPVLLPDVEDYLPEGSGKSPLAKNKAFVKTVCPQCGGAAERETDTLDTFVDSSWYFLRYTDPQNPGEFASANKQKNWMPVNLYSGGAEHTTMHLLYSRFWHKALYDCGLVADSEPYTRRMNRSIILGPDGQKMSKSRGNVIDPDEVVEKLGADTVRMYLAFIGPYNEVASYPWNPDGVVGIRRFLERVCRIHDYVQPHIEYTVPKLDAIVHRTIKKVGEDINSQKFNTAISALMILLNEIEAVGSLDRWHWDVFIKLLAPFAPHLAEELWSASAREGSVHLQSWPEFDVSLLFEKTITIAVQINGKTRGEVQVSSDAESTELEAAARGVVAARLEGKVISKTVVVPKRLVNFVVSE